MACGTPVVATAIEGYQELVGDTGSGSLVPPGDDDALAAAILTLLQDERARRAAAAAGADRARAFDWQAVAGRLEALYLGLARHGPFGPRGSTVSGRQCRDMRPGPLCSVSTTSVPVCLSIVKRSVGVMTSR